MTIRRYPDRPTALYRWPDDVAPSLRQPVSTGQLGTRFRRGILTAQMRCLRREIPILWLRPAAHPPWHDALGLRRSPRRAWAAASLRESATPGNAGDHPPLGHETGNFGRKGGRKPWTISCNPSVPSSRRRGLPPSRSGVAGCGERAARRAVHVTRKRGALRPLHSG